MVKLTFLQMIILTCFEKIDKDRTISSIYHMLVGKKSSQTIQDIHLYQLTHYFKTAPNMKRNEYDQDIKQLIAQKCAILIDNRDRLIITEKGKECVEQFISDSSIIPHLNGWKYHKYDYVFWQKLHLLIQTLSQLLHYDHKFIPIQSNQKIHNEIKDFFKKQTNTRFEIAEQLYSELNQVIENNFPVKPEVLIFRLSGYKYIGYTSEQIAELLRMEKSEYDFQFICAIHFVLKMISENQTRYPLLFQLIEKYVEELPYTTSTLRTKSLLEMGMNLETIAKKRNLKLSTIEDHIVEIVLHEENFPIHSFIDRKKLEQILLVAKRIGTRKLSPIMNEVDGVTYFQIRLALARMDVTT